MFSITSGKIEKAIKVVLYGPEGVGKTSFLSQFPQVVFIDTEGSTAHLDVRRLPTPTSWQMLLDEVAFVRDGGVNDCASLAIDTADWAERFCAEHICRKHKKGGIEDFGYGNGYTYMSEEFGKLLNLLNEVVERGINVAVAAHAQLVKFEQPDEAGAYDRWELKLGIKKTEKRTSQLLKEWADMLLFANYDTIVVKTDNNKYKGQGGSRRVMYTSHTSTWDAKNRQGLPDKTDFDFKVIAPFVRGAGVAAANPAAFGTDTKGAAYMFPEKGEPPKMVERKVKNEPPVPKTVERSSLGEVVTIATDEIPEFKAQELPEGIPQKLADLMQIHHVSEAEIRKAVAVRGFYPEAVPIAKYDREFIDGVLVAAWEQVKNIVDELRKNN